MTMSLLLMPQTRYDKMLRDSRSTTKDTLNPEPPHNTPSRAPTLKKSGVGCFRALSPRDTTPRTNAASPTPTSRGARKKNKNTRENERRADASSSSSRAASRNDP